MSSEKKFQIVYNEDYKNYKERLHKACGFVVDEKTKQTRVNPDAKLEDLMALMELNRAEAEWIQDGIRQRMSEGAKVARTAASLHDDSHLEGVLEKDK